MDLHAKAYRGITSRIEAAVRVAGRPPGDVTLVAASKMQPAAAIRGLVAEGQRRFGENRIQEALAKQRDLAGLGIEWHLIGPLQSNKCRDAAELFDWVQGLDRLKLVEPLSRRRPRARGPLNVLVEVNIDAEPGKAGCTPTEIEPLASAIVSAPGLRLRGLMAIPRPSPEPAERREAFARTRALFDALRAAHPGIDTLSMGMSDDFELAIAEGATMVRIGTALFGPRDHR
ncbi:MAG: YggS family pyridoxal phosphate-dependent enzyme [Lysobacterales bacterium]